MTTFNEVLQIVADECFQTTEIRNSKLCIVRDLRGRVRLAIEETDDNRSKLQEFERTITKRLDGYFVPPIIARNKGVEFGRLAEALIERGEQWPANWPLPNRDLISDPEDPPSTWKTLERVLAKEAWLTSQPFKPIWPYFKDKTPVVVTFHSFKGGVGRTTLAAAFGINQAISGKRVAVVDLDLEAPGLAALFSVLNVDRRGMLDVFVDHLAIAKINLQNVKERIPTPTGTGTLDVYPAGVLDSDYLAKLGRLDFASAEPGGESPVEAALKQFLKVIKDDYDVIIFDSRAGLHDLAGIALPAIAHVDALVFRGTTQGLQGLELTLSRLGQSRQIVLIETMLPANDQEYDLRLKRSRQKVYELLCKYNYGSEDLPQLSDEGDAHDLVGIGRKETLDNLDTILNHFDEVTRDREILEFVSRVTAACDLVDQTPQGEDE
jgi:cellulose biosynthesis protein BcsQ